MNYEQAFVDYYDDLDAEAERKALEERDDRQWRKAEGHYRRREEETRRTYASAMNAKHFDRAMTEVTDRLMRQRVLEARKNASDYLRNHSDEEIREFLSRKDSRGRDPDFVFSVTGPEMIQDVVVNIVRVTLPELHYVFHVCPRTGQIVG